MSRMNILGYDIAVTPTEVDDTHKEQFRKMGILLNVYIIDHTDMKLVHITAMDMRSNREYGYTGDNVNYGLDKVYADIKQDRA